MAAIIVTTLAAMQALGPVTLSQPAAGLPGHWVDLAGSAAALCLLVLPHFAVRGHYDQRLLRSRVAGDVLIVSTSAIVLAAAAAFVLALPLPRLAMLFVALGLPLALLGMRTLVQRVLMASRFWRLPVLVVGRNAWARRAAETVTADAWLGYDVAGFADMPQGTGAPIDTAWWTLLRQHRARMLILAFGDQGRPSSNVLDSLVRAGVPFAVLTEPDSLPVVGACMTPLNVDGALVCYRNNLNRPAARMVKTAADLAGAAAALAVLAPLMALIGMLVGLDGGPVLFSHPRIGARGRVFGCLKFRSMVVDSDEALRRHLAADPAAAKEWARTQKLRHDPRVTWIGRLLRKTSLDELPQLFNVLRLEMSLVGPRPIVSSEIGKYAEDIAYYYETRPGITGLWQVSGRSGTSYERRVQLDGWYARNWTLLLDLRILFRTLPAVLSARGAG